MAGTELDSPKFVELRDKMVSEQLVKRSIRDRRVLAAMAKIPRHRFLEPASWDLAYEDRPVPIGYGQTISQPYMVARMSELLHLEGGERVLEIGAGSGYQTAVLAELAHEIWAIERLPDLARRAEARLIELGYAAKVRLAAFDGTYGWQEGAPYDAILAAAGAPRIPVLLVGQLADGGRLVIPVGDRAEQRLAIVTRQGDSFVTEWDTACRFVDMIGRYAWGGDGPAQG
jgi:protein-L-isoaspartate(D-aspartate) O-methyltransferase